MKFLKYTKKSTIGKSAPLVLAGLLFGLATPVVQAALVEPADDGDFLLAFRRPQNQSGTYLVNIGSVSQLLSSTPGTAVPVPGVPNLGADLATFNIFVNDTPVNWHASANVLWGGIGRNAADKNTGYVTRKRPSLATQSVPWNPLSASAHASIFNTPVYGVISVGFPALEATPNNPNAGFQEVAPAGAQSPLYFYQVQTRTGGLDFGYWNNIEADFGATAANSALDLYEHRRPTDGNSSEVNYIGYFTITSQGALSFTRAAATVPGNTDSDGDGFTDAEEAIAGTDPNNGSSFFRLPAPTVVPGVSKSFSLPTLAGRTYIIEYNDDLAGEWIQVGTTAGTGSPWNYVDNNEGRNVLSRGFYRARVTNP